MNKTKRLAFQEYTFQQKTDNNKKHNKEVRTNAMKDSMIDEGETRLLDQGGGVIQMAVLNSVAEWPPGEHGTRALSKESGDPALCPCTSVG